MTNVVDAPPGYTKTGVKIGQIVDAPPGLGRAPATVDAPPGYTASGVKVGQIVDAPPGVSASLSSPSGKIQDMVRASAERYGVPVDFAMRLAKQESGFNPQAKSPVGAMGVMQLMGATAAGLGVKNPWDPQQNIDGGMRYIAQLQHQFKGNLQAMAGAYNAGPGAYEAHIKSGVPLPKETVAYINSVAPISQPFAPAPPKGKPVSQRAAAKPKPVAAPVQQMSLLGQIENHMASWWHSVTSTNEADAAQTKGPDNSGTIGVLSGISPTLGIVARAENAVDPQGMASQMKAVNAKHSALEEFGGVTDAPFIAVGALLRAPANKGDKAEVDGIKAEMQKAFALYKKDPAAANEEYGFMARRQLEAMKKSDDPVEVKMANYFLQHPRQAVTGAFLAEFANPGNDVPGALVNRAGKFIRTLRGGEKLLNNVAHVGSPLRDIVKEAGPEGKAKVMNVPARIGVMHHDADTITAHIFGGLTKEQEEEVVRRSQMLDPVAPTLSAERARGLKPWRDMTPEEREMQKQAQMHQGTKPQMPQPQRFRHPGLMEDSTGDLQRRADMLRQTIKRTTELQAAHPGLLIGSRIKDPEVYFPFMNQYRNPKYDAETEQYVREITGMQATGGGVNVRKGSAAANGPHQKNSYIDEALEAKDEAGVPKLKEDFRASTSFNQWLKRRGTNLAVEDTFKALPERLRMDIQPKHFVANDGSTLEDVIKNKGYKPDTDELPIHFYERVALDHNKNLGTADPKYISLSKLQVPKGYADARDVLSSMGSPTLRSSFVSHALGDYLARTSKGKGKNPSALDVFGDPILNKNNKFLYGAQMGFRKLDAAFRNALLQNPIVHPFGNIAPTFSQATTPKNPVMLAANYARAAVGVARAVVPELRQVFGSGRRAEQLGLNAFYHSASDVAEASAEALHLHQARMAGATFESGWGNTALEGDKVKLRTAAWSDLNGQERFDKIMTGLTDANFNVTFGKGGEEGFAVDLFHNLKKRGYSDEMAGMMTREQLGNYRDVDQNSAFSKYLFFAPWLKTKTAFWTKAFFTAPHMVMAWEEAARRQNEMYKDPRRDDPRSPVGDFQFYTGDGKSDEHFELNTPFNAPAKLMTAYMPGNADFTQRERAVESGLLGHLRPGPKVIYDTITTAADRKAENPMLPQNYRTMWDKDQDFGTQTRQWLTNAAMRTLPLGAAGALASDVAREGYNPSKLGMYVQNMGGLSTATERGSAAQEKAISRISFQYERKIAHARKNPNHEQQQKTVDYLLKQRDSAIQRVMRLTP